MIADKIKVKNKVIKLRLQGNSINDISLILGVPKSTLSGWLGHLKLTSKQKNIIANKTNLKLIEARRKASLWHTTKKEERIEHGQSEMDMVLEKINIYDKNIIILATSLIYFGEGFKGDETRIGNSNPLILKFFIKCLTDIFNVDIKSIYCELHLRFDQNEDDLKKIWSDELQIPISQFYKTSFDKRTKRSKTFKDYLGVCVINCGNVAIKRKLIYLSRIFCENVIGKKGD